MFFSFHIHLVSPKLCKKGLLLLKLPHFLLTSSFPLNHLPSLSLLILYYTLSRVECCISIGTCLDNTETLIKTVTILHSSRKESSSLMYVIRGNARNMIRDINQSRRNTYITG